VRKSVILEKLANKFGGKLNKKIELEQSKDNNSVYLKTVIKKAPHRRTTNEIHEAAKIIK
jgi:hypothetical protein